MKKLVVILGSVVVFLACNKTNVSNVDCTTVSAKFSTDVAPILQATCNGSSCHGSSSSRPMLTYAQVSPYISNGTFKKEVVTNKTMPEGSSLTTAQLNTISCWLNAGAQNN